MYKHEIDSVLIERTTLYIVSTPVADNRVKACGRYCESAFRVGQAMSEV